MAQSRDRKIGEYSLDFPDYAQEFLRRNQDYKRQYSDLQAEREAGLRPSVLQRMARSWDLEFPDRSIEISLAGACHLEGPILFGHSHPSR